MELGTWFPAEVLRLTISDTSGYTRGMLELAVKPLPDIFNLDYSRVELLPCYYLLLMMVTVIYIVACVGGRGTLWGSILAGFFFDRVSGIFSGAGCMAPGHVWCSADLGDDLCTEGPVFD
ncbi:MAG: hypothetical protein QGE94_01780 [Desulfobacterales bacterium]|nr:hypothetical protein [Desulfobacterales bacterium]